MDNGFTDFLIKHKFTILLTLLGLILVILFFTIGFWRTIVLLLILALCFFVGFLLDKSGTDGIRTFFDKLFKKDK